VDAKLLAHEEEEKKEAFYVLQISLWLEHPNTVLIQLNRH